MAVEQRPYEVNFFSPSLSSTTPVCSFTAKPYFPGHVRFFFVVFSLNETILFKAKIYQSLA